MATQPIYLLSTGALPERTGGQLADGLVLDILPFITIEPVTDALLWSRVKELAGHRTAVIFTSVHAAEAVGERVRSGVRGEDAENRLSREAGGNQAHRKLFWKIYCIGMATRQRVADYFGETAIEGTADSAAALAEVIAREEKARELVFFCGDLRRDELPAVLQQKGFAVEELVVYRTVAIPHKTGRGYDGIAFFSPSAVESYFSVNTVDAGALLFAIGRTTAAAISSRCDNTVVVGERPDKGALIRKMIDHFSKKR